MKKVTNTLKLMIAMMFAGRGRKVCLAAQRFFAKMRESYAKMRSNAKVDSDFAIKESDIAPVRALRQAQLWLFKVMFVCLTLMTQPLLRMAGLALMESSISLMVTLLVMAALTAVWISTLIVVPAQNIPDDADYKRFMKTLWRVFLGVSVALPTLDWQVACIFWRSEYVRATDALMAFSFVAFLSAAAMILLMFVAIVLCWIGWGINKLFIKKKPETSTALAVIPEKDRETHSGRLTDE